MTTLNPGDLSELERVLLGVLGIGLAPSTLAGDPTLRYDYVTAVSLALWRGLPRDTYLDDGATLARDFQRELTAAVHALTQKRILEGEGPGSGVVLGLGGEPSMPVVPEEMADFNSQPRVFDRYLAGRCLDDVLKQPEVYRFIMDKYADSSEVWQRLYQESDTQRRS